MKKETTQVLTMTAKGKKGKTEMNQTIFCLHPCSGSSLGPIMHVWHLANYHQPVVIQWHCKLWNICWQCLKLNEVYYYNPYKNSLIMISFRPLSHYLINWNVLIIACERANLLLLLLSETYSGRLCFNSTAPDFSSCRDTTYQLGLGWFLKRGFSLVQLLSNSHHKEEAAKPFRTFTISKLMKEWRRNFLPFLIE